MLSWICLVEAGRLEFTERLQTFVEALKAFCYIRINNKRMLKKKKKKKKASVVS